MNLVKSVKTEKQLATAILKSFNEAEKIMNTMTSQAKRCNNDSSKN